MGRASVMLVVAILATGSAAAAADSPRFSDVPEDHVFAGQIEWLADQGITRGCNPPANDRFCPDDVVTRGQMAAFLVRALGLTYVDPELPVFVDAEHSMFLGDIMRLGSAGVTRGCNPPANDRFCPDDVVTRGQMAAFLDRSIPDALRIDTLGLDGGTVGVPFAAELSASGGRDPYVWTALNLPDGLELTPAGLLSGVPATSGSYLFSVQVSDDDGATAALVYEFDVDYALVFETETIPVWIRGEMSSFSMAASGGEPPYTWSAMGLPAGLVIDATGMLSGSSSTIDDYNVTFTVVDDDGRESVGSRQVRVVNPFFIVSTTVMDGTVSDVYSDTLTVSGGEPPYSWEADAVPAGLAVDDVGVLSGTPTEAGSYVFTATVTDSLGKTATSQISVDIYDQLVIDTASIPGGTRGESYSALLTASGGKPPYSWSGQMPSGLTLSASGEISGVPSAASSSGVTVHVADQAGRSSARDLVLDVRDPVDITTLTLPVGTVEETYSATLNASGGEPPYVWSGVMPPGLTLAANGSLSGFPTQAGSHGVTFHVTDQGGRYDARYLTVEVFEALVVQTPLLSGTVGENFSYTLNISGGQPPYSWEGTPPDGLVLGGDGTITGTLASTGEFWFDIEVNDSGGRSAVGTFILDVDDPLTIPYESLPDGWLHVPYDVTLHALGGEPPYTWERGEIPPGVGMYSYGVFTGAPLWGGYWDVPFTVTDADGRTAQKTLPLFVAGAKRMSVNYEYEQGNGAVIEGSVSGDGRYVPYASAASNMLAGDTDDDWDIYVYDTYSRKVTRVSVTPEGSEATGDCQGPEIDYDGDMVAFVCNSFDIWPVGGGYFDIYARDVAAGTTIRVSENALGERANHASAFPRLSDDGRYVAFYSYATNLVLNDTNEHTDVFVKDLQTGGVVRASVATDGTQGNGYSGGSLDISGDGRWLAFSSDASNLVPGDDNGVEDIFLHDLWTGVTSAVTVSIDGQPLDGDSYAVRISQDGSKLVYRSSAGNLVAGDTNGTPDIFVFDRLTAVTQRVSYKHDGSQLDGDVHWPFISGNGRVVQFATTADGVVPGDNDGRSDVFAVDLVDGDITLLSVGAYGAHGTGSAYANGLTHDGVFGVFRSFSSAIVPNDTNGYQDIFIAAVDLR